MRNLFVSAFLLLATSSLSGCGESKRTVDMGGRAGAAGSGATGIESGGLSLAWLRGFGGPEIAMPFRLDAHAPGRVTLTGMSSSSIDFGGGPLTPADGYAQLVATLDDSGNYLSSSMAVSADNQDPMVIATNTAQNGLIAGGFEGTEAWGDLTFTSLPQTATVFLAGLTPDGTPSWGTTLASSGFEPCVALNDDGTAFVAAVGPYGMIRGGTIFLAKLDDAGQTLWTKSFSETVDERGDHQIQTFALARDNAGDVILLGGFDAPVDLGGGPLTPAEAGDLFVAKFDANGTLLWSRAAGGFFGGVMIGGLAVNAAGDIAVIAPFDSACTFGADPAVVEPGSENVLVVKLDANGTPLFVRRGNVVVADDVALDQRGHVFVIGDGMPAFLAQPPPETQPSFVVEYDAAGDVASFLVIEGDGTYASSIAAAPDGNIFISGSFGKGLAAGGRAIKGVGYSDIYVGKLARSP